MTDDKNELVEGVKSPYHIPDDPLNFVAFKKLSKLYLLIIADTFISLIIGVVIGKTL